VEDCISYTTACPYFPVPSASLVADDRSEIGSPTRTRCSRTRTEATEGCRRRGLPGPLHRRPGGKHRLDPHDHADGGRRQPPLRSPRTGVVIDNEADVSNAGAVFLFDDHVAFEWIEIKGGSGANAHGINIGAPGADNLFNLRYNLIHEVGGTGSTSTRPPTPSCTSRTRSSTR